MKKFETPILDIEKFTVVDVITASVDTGCDQVGDSETPLG